MDENLIRYTAGTNMPLYYPKGSVAPSPGNLPVPQQYSGGVVYSSVGGCGCGNDMKTIQMAQIQNNDSDCGCNDYSLLTGNTGIGTLLTANPNLDGTGTLATVITAAANGTKVRSVTIKATEAVKAGMVRLFIKKAGVATTLIMEIPIPECPVLAATPTPPPVLPVFELRIACNIELRSGYSLMASTQSAYHFNVIAEGLDYAYPASLPDTCCNFLQNTTNNGIGGVNTANSNLNGTGTIANIYTAGAAGSSMNGSKIKMIKIKALQNTHDGMVRLFISNDSGTTYFLYKEICIPESVPSAYQPSFEYTINECFYLKNGYIIAASTERAEAFAITIEGDDWKYPIS